MAINGESIEMTPEYLHGRTVALQAQVDEIRRDTAGIARLSAEVRHLANQVRSLGQAIGLRAQTPLPDDWEDITQVRRPELHQLRHRATEAEQQQVAAEQRVQLEAARARRGRLMGIGTVIAAVIVEIVRAIVEGRLSVRW